MGLTQEEKMWAGLSHIAALLGNLIGIGQFLVPLILYFIYKEKSKFVAFHALQSLLFQVALWVAGIAVGIFAAVIGALTFGIGALLAIPAALVVGIGGLVLIIIAAVRAFSGDLHEYIVVGRYARNVVGV